MVVMKLHTPLIAAVSLFVVGAQAGDKAPAILKNLGAKQGVQTLDKSKMSNVRGEAIINVNLGTSNLTVRALEPGTVLRLTSVGTTNGSPGGTQSQNLLNLGLIYSSTSGPAQPPTTHTVNYGVLDGGKLINYSSTAVANP